MKARKLLIMLTTSLFLCNVEIDAINLPFVASCSLLAMTILNGYYIKYNRDQDAQKKQEQENALIALDIAERRQALVERTACQPNVNSQAYNRIE